MLKKPFIRSDFTNLGFFLVSNDDDDNDDDSDDDSDSDDDDDDTFVSFLMPPFLYRLLP